MKVKTIDKHEQLFEVEENGKRFTARMLSNNSFEKIGETDKLKAMHNPVKCNHCGEAYDLGTVKVLHRYDDCTDFETPCCKRRVDDRMYISRPAYTTLPKI